MKDWLTRLQEAKSHDLPSVSWRPRKASGIVPVQTQKPENQEPLIFESRRRYIKQLMRREWIHLSSAILFYLGYQWIGWCPSALVRSLIFTQFMDSNANFFQRHKDTARNNVFSAIWASHKISHHRDIMILHGKTRYCKDTNFLQINL